MLPPPTPPTPTTTSTHPHPPGRAHHHHPPGKGGKRGRPAPRDEIEEIIFDDKRRQPHGAGAGAGHGSADLLQDSSTLDMERRLFMSSKVHTRLCMHHCPAQLPAAQRYWGTHRSARVAHARHCCTYVRAGPWLAHGVCGEGPQEARSTTGVGRRLLLLSHGAPPALLPSTPAPTFPCTAGSMRSGARAGSPCLL